MKYDGWDWIELAKEFGTYENDSSSDDLTLKRTKDYLVENHFSNSYGIAKEIRLFLNQLYIRCLEGKKYNAPIWKGLLEVEDDFTIIKYTIILLEHMWF